MKATSNIKAQPLSVPAVFTACPHKVKALNVKPCCRKEPGNKYSHCID